MGVKRAIKRVASYMREGSLRYSSEDLERLRRLYEMNKGDKEIQERYFRERKRRDDLTNLEELVIEYEANPENVDLREAYIRECLKENKEPTIWYDWVEKTYGISESIRIQGLARKEGLYLYDGTFTDLKWLSGVSLPSARKIEIRLSSLSTLSGLEGLDAPGVTSIWIGGQAGIKDLKGLDGFKAPNLRALRVEHTDLRSLEGISEFTTLTSLDVSRNELTSVGELANMSLNNLGYLEMADNNISNFDGLRGKSLPNLVHLQVANNKTTDVSPLFTIKAPKLRRLYLASMGLSGSDLETLDLSRFPSLEEINLNLNNIRGVLDLPRNLRIQLERSKVKVFPKG
jgi:Leucine-rich repeat (LRR) protein